MIYTLASKKEYIPKWNGNRSLPKNEQGKVIIGFPSVLDIVANSGEVDNALLFEFKNHIKEISGFQVQGDDGKIREMIIDDIIELPGLVELFEELRKEYRRLTNVDKKK